MNLGCGGPALSARGLALRVLADIEHGAWVDRVLARREDRLADARDRRFLHLLVLTTLRWQGALDEVLERFVHGGTRRVEPLVRAGLRTGLVEAALLDRPGAIAVSASVDAVSEVAGRRAAGLVNAVLRRALQPGPPPLDPEATVPRWLLERWRARWGAPRARALIEAINRPASAFLVARPGAGGREALARALAASGVKTERSGLHPEGLRVIEGVPQRTPSFARGEFVLLDGAAALVAELAAPQDARPIADLAAAPGGKLALLADRAAGPVVALEFAEGRARALASAVAGWSTPAPVTVMRGDARRPPLARRAFGLVLLDAPCSGTGTLRRRPDRRWRVTRKGIGAAAAMQRSLLDAAAELVAPGGAMVYAVCSMEVEEGAAQVEQFLERRPDFRVADPRPLLPAAARDFTDESRLIVETRPDLGDLDGFCAARLERRE